MTTINSILGLVGSILLFLGVFIFVIEIFGIYRYRFVLNRMHAAGMGDTLGLLLCLVGLMLISGINYTTLKLLLVIIFMWMTSPTSSHLISGLVTLTDDRLPENADVKVEDLKSHVELTDGFEKSEEEKV